MVSVNNIAVIPARGGSKRIPRKNIKEFCSKPMIFWSIQAAKNSGLFDEIFVSTDDEEIANLAKKLGAIIPFTRPKNLSDDFSTTHDVIFHAASFLNDANYIFDNICCLYPCSPFIQSEDLHEAFNLLRNKKNCYIYPITEYPHPISRALQLSKDNRISLFNREHEKTRTQDLVSAYHDAGQFYWGSKETWLKIDQIHSNAFGLPIPSWRAIDIDNEDDWKRAEIAFKALNYGS